jgi:hypothetical protein
MRFRKLRIAWSVFWGLACVLLIVLWVRSYWWGDVFTFPQSSQGALGIGSINARIMFGATNDDTFPLWEWLVEPNRQPAEFLPWFEVSIRSVSSEMYVPDWLLVILTISVAVLPWIRQLSWRFSLRTLLIATTLLAVVLGLVVYVSRK